MVENFTLIKNNPGKCFVFNFEKVNFFQGNMAVLLDLLKRYSFQNDGTSYLSGCKDHITELFKRNEFFKTYTEKEVKIEDQRKTTINFQRHYLEEENSEKFYEYIDNKFLNHYRLDGISEVLKEKIQESIIELYTNIIQHGESEFVATCGQFFPKSKKLIFSIGNLGNTFYEKISKKTGILQEAECIEWALEESNSTKDVPGGIGLYTFSEFIKSNRGQIQIISGRGFYEEFYLDEDEKFIKNKKKLSHKFPGTIVTLIINLDQNIILEEDLYDYNF